MQPEAFRMLLLLHRESRHPYALVCAVERCEGAVRSPSRANLFRRLRTLRSQGLVEPIHGDEPCRRAEPLRLTAYGRAVMEAEVARLRTLVAEAATELSGGAS